MIALSGFALRASDPEEQLGELIDPGGHPRTVLNGAVLEAIYQLGDGCYFVISADGDAFEDCLHLTLCDSTFLAREVVHVGGAYQTGRFRARQVGPGPRLRFSFFADELWQLEILSEPRWRLHLPRPAIRHSPTFRPGRLWLVRDAQAR